MIAEIELRIKQIAPRAGFRYIEYVTRLFRRLTGQTPTEFRQTNFATRSPLPQTIGNRR